ncbi:hypothetical protein [Parafrankia discariae]|uniref:hypothetical protein n=1 Tax=Parafrankia discariae TaxID=365528 RepID=UPI0012B6A539|nr:hypothetical protein [Parafrankia discariae]
MDHPRIQQVGMAYRYAMSWTGRDRRPPVIPILLQPDPDDPASAAPMAVMCATGRIGRLPVYENAGWRELTEYEASNGRVIGGWMVLAPVRRRGYKVQRLWLNTPLQYPPNGPPVDLTAIRWPTHTPRRELANTVRMFPSTGSWYFPDPDALRWNLLAWVQCREA